MKKYWVTRDSEKISECLYPNSGDWFFDTEAEARELFQSADFSDTQLEGFCQLLLQTGEVDDNGDIVGEVEILEIIEF